MSLTFTPPSQGSGQTTSPETGWRWSEDLLAPSG